MDIFQDLGEAMTIFSYIWFILLPIAFYLVFKTLWMDYINDIFGSSIEFVVLEIVPPKDIEKSPQPMESIYAGLMGALKGFDVLEEFVQGMFTFSFSLEIVSDGGQVHFYIRTPKMFRNLIEAHFYAQYPDIEIFEVPDYVASIPSVMPNKNWDLWGVDFKLNAPDPLPIRTYKFFEEDITGTMIDPLSSLIESFGKVAPGQQVWLQFVVTPLASSWSSQGKDLVKKLAGREGSPPKSMLEKLTADVGDVFTNIPAGIMGGEKHFSSHVAEKKEAQPVEFMLTPGEKKVLEALESNIGKNVFKTKMRLLCLGRKENFSKDTIPSIVGSLSQFADGNLNSFGADGLSKTFASYFRIQERLRFRQRRIFSRYVSRSSLGKTFILSTEELATVFHIPDISVKAPFIQRVNAKRSTAPSNLPIMME